MPQQYKTKQRAMVETLMKEYSGEHLTADEIVRRLGLRGHRVGKATVYRCLERMMEQGEVKKYAFGEGKSACYEYQAEKKPPHYHLKCSDCGGLTHLKCSVLDELPQHILLEHGFSLDASQIVLVGRCRECASRLEGEAL